MNITKLLICVCAMAKITGAELPGKEEFKRTLEEILSGKRSRAVSSPEKIKPPSIERTASVGKKPLKGEKSFDEIRAEIMAKQSIEERYDALVEALAPLLKYYRFGEKNKVNSEDIQLTNDLLTGGEVLRRGKALLTGVPEDVQEKIGQIINLPLNDLGFNLLMLIAQNRFNHHPLVRNKFVAIERLIELGANPTAKDIHGSTALHYFVRENRFDADFLALLLKLGVMLDAPDNQGKTPLYWAIKNESEPFVNALLAYNANPDIPDKEGKTPRELATKSIYEGIARLLKN